MASALELLPRSERFAVVVIDVQERLSAAMPVEDIAAVTRNTVILMETAKEFSMPLVVSEQYPKGLGPSVAQVRAALPGGLNPVEKLAFSCCAEPPLRAVLEPLIDYDLILCGIEAHVCVLQTAVDLLRWGCRVFVAADAVCSRTTLNRQLGLDLMRQAGAVIGSTEIFAFALVGRAGNDRFKWISKLVK